MKNIRAVAAIIEKDGRLPMTQPNITQKEIKC